MVMRYGIRMTKHFGEHSPYMPTEFELLDGEYVKYEDYEQLQAQVNDMEQALEQVRVFATSHIHLEYGTVFVKVRRNMFLAAIKGEGEEYRAVSKQEEDEIFKKIFERHELEIHTAGSLKSKEDE